MLSLSPSLPLIPPSKADREQVSAYGVHFLVDDGLHFAQSTLREPREGVQSHSVLCARVSGESQQHREEREAETDFDHKATLQKEAVAGHSGISRDMPQGADEVLGEGGDTHSTLHPT